ncbi:unnamed protein product [Moneuplotes crassus]|uniref:Uncharacterized protein n=1 Tax=Euplotes crassus TaxID=5936 RepID=A0AAD1UJI3_EUPCR|nr:unnamed protein product [Moneuplotes crassus]
MIRILKIKRCLYTRFTLNNSCILKAVTNDSSFLWSVNSRNQWDWSSFRIYTKLYNFISEKSSSIVYYLASS